MKRLLIAAALLAASTAALAQSAQSSAVQTGGFGKWLIDSLFESGSVSDMAQQPGIIGTVIMPLSLMCFVVVLGLITLKSIQHFIVVSQAKNIEASPVSMTWAPIHILIAVSLSLPMPSGYSLGQYGAIWIAEQSNSLGNLTAQRATSFIANRGLITPPPMPSMQSFVDAVAMSSTCKVMFNKYGDHMADLDNNRSWVQEKISRGSNADGSNNLTESEDFISTVIVYERKMDLNGEAVESLVDNFCGKMVLSYKKPPSGADLRNNLPVFRVDPEQCSDNESNFCFQEGETVQAALYDQMYQVNEALNTFLMGNNGVATNTNASHAQTITSNLLYDFDLRLQGATDAEALDDALVLLGEEEARISAAVEAAADLYEQTRDRMYSAYARAINSNNTQGAAGDWIDNLDRAGWPLLGLYWFQFTNTNRAVGEASQLQFSYTGSMDRYFDSLYAATEDRELVTLLRNRYAKFQKQFTAKIQNTRFDSQPLVDETRSNAAAMTGITEAEMKALNAADLRENIPAMIQTFQDQAGNGNDNVSGDTGNVMDLFTVPLVDDLNDWSRSFVFPLLVNTLKDGDIVSSMVNTGHTIIAISEGVYVANLWFRTASAANNGPSGGDGDSAEEEDNSVGIWSWLTNPIGSLKNVLSRAVEMISLVLDDFASYWKYLFFAGLFLAFYLPSMIMIQWLIGVVTWIIYLLEATVIIPIWSLLFVGEMGEKSFSPQTARQGFVHLLSILLYPTLMVIGFIFGLKVIDLISPFIVDFLLIGFLNATDGYAFGLVSFAAGLILLAIAAYQIIIRIFSIVLEFNDRAMSWIGQRVGYGEASGEQGARGGFVGAINEGKMDARMGGGRPGKGRT
jgi:conjugal transfer/type IV secretion protein DotA/TraY